MPEEADIDEYDPFLDGNNVHTPPYDTESEGDE